jgi:hypothetical protein
MKWLDYLSDIASITTALVAVLAYGTYQLKRWQLRRRIESHLKTSGTQKFIPQIAAELWITKEQVFDAAARSPVLEGA